MVVFGAVDRRAGLFPLESLLGLPYWTCFLAVAGATMTVTILLVAGRRWQLLSFATLAALVLAAYDWPKIGKEYMPRLDEGSFLDMPVTVPRISVTQAAADLKNRDEILRGFPEIEAGCGQGGPCRHSHRSIAAGHGRKRHYARPPGLGRGGSLNSMTHCGRRKRCWPRFRSRS